MFVSMKPEQFQRFGLKPPRTEPGWLVDGKLYTTNPRFLLTEADHIMLTLWRAYRRDMNGTAGHLPEPGGTLQQNPAMMEGLEAMDSMARELDNERLKAERAKIAAKGSASRGRRRR